ncbi:MAG: DUF3387 domain-containing protein [Chloroflexi bacterium]|nr:DUF3387 domain-containing protein [Chloroflexota bacterium]
MTGFDVPSCSTIYLDKPMRNHTLMQTIARANRVFKDKVNGLIVDYIGVFRDLQRALAIYGSAPGGGLSEGETPIKDKSALIEQVRRAIVEATAFCTDAGVDVASIQNAAGFHRISMIDDAVEALIMNDEAKRRFLSLAGNVDRLFKAILPDTAANDFGPARALFNAIAEKIRNNGEGVDIADFMESVDRLLDQSIATEGYVIREPLAPYNTHRQMNLSEIDFEALRKRFAQSRKRSEADKLRGALNAKVQDMVRLNKSRMDYAEKLQAMIDEYNSGAANIEIFFENLVKLAQELSVEEQRSIAEQLTEEELAVFDLLTRPEIAF